MMGPTKQSAGKLQTGSLELAHPRNTGNQNGPLRASISCCNDACGPRTKTKTYNRSASHATIFLLGGASEYQGAAGYGWEASCFSDSAISLRKTSTAGTEGDASASLPEYRHTGGASSGDQLGSVLPR
jgi:hypothetical protein